MPRNRRNRAQIQPEAATQEPVALVVPESAAEYTFNPQALNAIRTFRRSKPWQGTVAERKAKFKALNAALAAAYGIAVPKLKFESIDAATVDGNGCYTPTNHTITLLGKLSVVTYLHEFGHARGFGERGAVRWSVNVFRRCFPRSFARCEPMGHMIKRRADWRPCVTHANVQNGRCRDCGERVPAAPVNPAS